MATLIISHNLYLNYEQRYALHERNAVEVIGVSVPVWFRQGNTSEPAKEIFCKYKITNEFKTKSIISNEAGYTINLPQIIEFKSGKLEQEVQSFVNNNMPTSKKLLDIKDGGSEWLEFRHFTKLGKHNLIHFVEIKPEEVLFDTLS